MKTTLLNLFFLVLTFSSCQKSNDNVLVKKKGYSLSFSNSLLNSKTNDISYFGGLYNVSGTRIYYASPTDQFTVDLSNYSPQIMGTSNPNTLVCNYADMGNSGWQYKITLDSTLHNIVKVEPYGQMVGRIAPNSWIVLISTLNYTSRKIHLKTKYKTFYGNYPATTNETLIHQ